jgi:hypothetical protein
VQTNRADHTNRARNNITPNVVGQHLTNVRNSMRGINVPNSATNKQHQNSSTIVRLESATTPFACTTSEKVVRWCGGAVVRWCGALVQ